MTVAHPETQEAVAEVLQAAIRVIGDEGEALRWLGTPVRVLDYATPISMLNQPNGKDAVMGVLTNLEHGVF
jgi:putative toxin-antitoxin system antitoxin component (TIGR02293 family)